MKSPLIVLVLLLAACSSSTPKAAPTTTLAPSVITTPGVTVGSDGTGCTRANLGNPALEMPEPRVVTAGTVLKSAEGYGARLDPTPDATPTVSGSDAWGYLTKLEPIRARSGELSFGRFRVQIPFGPRGPQKLNLLAWVLQVTDFVYPYPADQPQLGVCSLRQNAYFVIDATTGARVLDSY